MNKLFYIMSGRSAPAIQPLTIVATQDGVGGQFRIATDPTEVYNYDVDFGDGTVFTNQTGDVLHTFATSGTYDVTITGQFPKFFYNNMAQGSLIKEIKHWGTNHQWSVNQRGAFLGCRNLIITSPTPPNMSPTNIRDFCNGCTALTDANNSLAGIDVSNLIDARNAFDQTPNLNADLSGWNITPTLEVAQGMFAGSGINFSLGNWNISGLYGTNFMLIGSGLSEANYNATLIGWANLPSLQMNNLFRADGMVYSGAGKVARQFIINNYNWTFQNDIDGDV